MANNYEREYRNYADVIDDKIETPSEARLWENVRLHLAGKPKFLGTLSSPPYRLYCIVELGICMGEGKVRIPLGLYGDQHDRLDEMIVTHNRQQLNYTGGESMATIAALIGLRWGFTDEDIKCNGGGGYEIFRTPGYELILLRSLRYRTPKEQLILLPRDDRLLHALAAHGLTQHIGDVLGEIRVSPIAPQELQLTAS